MYVFCTPFGAKAMSVWLLEIGLMCLEIVIFLDLQNFGIRGNHVLTRC